MKAILLLALGLFCSSALCQPPQPPTAPPPPHPPAYPIQQQPTADKDLRNYTITVNWSDAKAGTNFLRVLTTEGSFNLETVQSTVRINDADIPTTVSLKGTLAQIAPDKATLKIFLGRTVPYVTSTYYGGGSATPSSSYQQMRVGLDSSFAVSFGKPLTIQADKNGEVTVVVNREEK